MMTTKSNNDTVVHSISKGRFYRTTIVIIPGHTITATSYSIRQSCMHTALLPCIPSRNETFSLALCLCAFLFYERKGTQGIVRDGMKLNAWDGSLKNMFKKLKDLCFSKHMSWKPVKRMNYTMIIYKVQCMLMIMLGEGGRDRGSLDLLCFLGMQLCVYTYNIIQQANHSQYVLEKSHIGIRRVTCNIFSRETFTFVLSPIFSFIS